MLNNLKDLPEILDRWANGALSTDIREAAEQVVSELQEAGPLWSGEFSNSWVIETSMGNKSSPSRAKGLPQPVQGRLLSGVELFTKPEVKYKIYNVAPYAGVAIDYEQPEREFTRPKDYKTPLQKASKTKPGERNSSNIRGDVAEGPGGNISTAPLDWYDTYLKGGNIDRTIKVAMDRAFKKFPR